MTYDAGNLSLIEHTNTRVGGPVIQRLSLTYSDQGRLTEVSDDTGRQINTPTTQRGSISFPSRMQVID